MTPGKAGGFINVSRSKRLASASRSGFDGEAPLALRSASRRPGSRRCQCKFAVLSMEHRQLGLLRSSIGLSTFVRLAADALLPMDSRKRQTTTAAPAEPGGFLVRLVFAK